MASEKLGFSGTRRGMTAKQQAVFAEILAELQPIEFHHGLCEGADAQAHEAFRKYAESHPECFIVGHPGPEEDPHQEFELYDDCEGLEEPLTHLARNRAIVNQSDVIFATPLESTHQAVGGTWYTVDYAKKVGKPTIVCYGDGRVERTGF